MSDEILVEEVGAILRVTINRPQEGNGVTNAMAVELAEAIDRAHETSEMVLLRSAGKDFTIGRAPDPSAPPPPSEAYGRRNEYDDAIFNCYRAIRRSPVPVVSLIQGRAMGFGTAVAALSDVSFASDTATFNIPELSRDVMPTIVMSALFDRISRNAILWMTYSTDFISAERALMYGIVSTVVSAAKLEAEVASFCDKMANTPRPAIRGLKEYLRVAPNMDTEGGIDYARSLHAVVNSASEMKSKSRKLR